MGFLDKAKEKASQLAEQAKDKIGDVKEKRKVDDLLDDLGRIVYRQRTERGEPGDEAEIVRLVGELRTLEAEGTDVLARRRPPMSSRHRHPHPHRHRHRPTGRAQRPRRPHRRSPNPSRRRLSSQSPTATVAGSGSSSRTRSASADRTVASRSPTDAGLLIDAARRARSTKSIIDGVGGGRRHRHRDRAPRSAERSPRPSSSAAA